MGNHLWPKTGDIQRNPTPDQRGEYLLEQQHEVSHFATTGKRASQYVEGKAHQSKRTDERQRHPQQMHRLPTLKDRRDSRQQKKPQPWHEHFAETLDACPD